MTTEPPQRSRWFQFRLRTLLIAVLVLSVPLSWFAVKMDKARKQRKAISALSDLESRPVYVYQDGTQIYEMNLKILYEYQDVSQRPIQTPNRPTWLRQLVGGDFFHDVTYVDISNTYADDSSLIHLKLFPKLRYLNLKRTLVTDVGLKQLREFNRLEDLDLPDQVTADGLRQLKGLNITALNVPSHFTDDDLAVVAACFPTLEHLNLSGTKVTDKGLEHLKGMANLVGLYARKTKVTEAGREQFPNVTVFIEDDFKEAQKAVRRGQVRSHFDWP